MRILCWSISAIIFIGWGAGRIMHPGNANFPHHFFLFKYALDILFINGAVAMFAWPLLINKGIIGANYQEENEFGQAKIFLIIYAMLFPGILLVEISALITKQAFIPSSLIFALFCYGYFKNGYIYFIKQKKKQKNPLVR